MSAVAFSRRGDRLVTAARDGDARLWNARTGKLLRLLKIHVSTVSEVRFSPNGRWIVTAGPSKAGVWETQTGDLLFLLRGHRQPLTSASFAPDGRRILTSSADGTVRSVACEVCTDLRGLRVIAKHRLAQIVRARG